MSYFDKPFEAKAEEAQQAFTPIPEADYNLDIEKCEESKSKANNAMLKMTFVVHDGEHEGRKLFANINLEHENKVVVEIGTRQLHALCILCGLASIKDATDLVGRSIRTKVKVTKRKDTGELVNEVVLALRKGADTTAPPASQPAPSTGTAPKTGDKSTW